jgi:hypothetical protein
MDKPVATYKSNELPIFVESGITVMLFLLLILVQSEGRLLLNRSVAEPPQQLRTSQSVP